MRRLRNMTITVEEDVARWARVRAAEEDTSVARLVGEMLKGEMAREQSYQEAMKAYLMHRPSVLKRKGARYPAREDLHDRSRLR